MKTIEQTTEAVNLLRAAGFRKVAELKGGIPA
jgi:rhodanese-related sulfurtransferase